MPRLDTLPEELLERILGDAIAAVPADLDQRPPWLRSPTHRPDFRLAPLLVCKRFARIGLPIFYQSIHLRHPTTAAFLRRSLEANPHFASLVRHLSVSGISDHATAIIRLCADSLKTLEVALAPEEIDEDSEKSSQDLEQEYAEALRGLTGLQHFVLRKPSNVYLSLSRSRFMIFAVAQAIPCWPELESASVAFKLSDDTPTSPPPQTSATSPSYMSFNPFLLPFPTTSPPPSPTPETPQLPFMSSSKQSGPISSLALALASAPKLHTFSTHLPSVWNASILAISSNPRLERIVLSSPSSLVTAGRTAITSPTSHVYHTPGGYQAGIVGTGLFLMEARRHPRLTELIKAGTAIIRTRARSLESPVTPGPHAQGRRVPGPGGVPSQNSPASPVSPTPMGRRGAVPIGLGIKV